MIFTKLVSGIEDFLNEDFIPDKGNVFRSRFFIARESGIFQIKNFPETGNFSKISEYQSLRILSNIWDKHLTLRHPKQHSSQAPDVPDLAQMVKPW